MTNHVRLMSDSIEHAIIEHLKAPAWSFEPPAIRPVLSPDELDIVAEVIAETVAETALPAAKKMATGEFTLTVDRAYVDATVFGSSSTTYLPGLTTATLTDARGTRLVSVVELTVNPDGTTAVYYDEP